jgi:uncharacterized membrane protein
MERLEAGAGVEFSQMTRRNCSLSPTGRKLFLAVIITNTAFLAFVWAALGAWPVLPWAGLELVILTFAFYWIGRYDGDYEQLTISHATVRYETRERGVMRRFECNRAWSQVVCRMRGRRCSLALRYQGAEVSLGRLMSDEGRFSLAQELRQQLRLVAN